MLKRIFTDPAFLFLIAINIYCIWYYENNQGEFYSLVFLYWGQSVLIGLFNFADLLTVREILPGTMTINDAHVTNSSRSKGCAAFFFLVHYGIFHIVYGIFILVQSKLDVDFRFILLGLAAFSLTLIIQFIQQKQLQKTIPANIGKMFFTPYLRIIPMHLMILGPVFLNWEASAIFLVLKTFADIIMYLITSPFHKPAAQVN